MPIVTRGDLALTPGRYLKATELESLSLVWRDDGDGAWALCAICRPSG